jgi:hypothetical protein
VQRATVLQEYCYQSRPACLVTGSQARAGLGVKVFMKWNAVAPVRIIAKISIVPKRRATSIPIVIAQEYPT